MVLSRIPLLFSTTVQRVRRNRSLAPTCGRRQYRFRRFAAVSLHHPAVPLSVAAITALSLSLVLPPAYAGSPTAHATNSPVVQPKPPIQRSAFHFEQIARRPRLGDGLIPNPLTPTGRSANSAPSCDRVAHAPIQSAATVNRWIRAHENNLTSPYTICLAGTFHNSIHVWGKHTTPLLILRSQPGTRASIVLGRAKPNDTSPISIIGSQGVEVFGITIKNFTTNTSFVPIGISVSVAAPPANGGSQGPPNSSACFLHGNHRCGNIYLLHNTITRITTADRLVNVQSLCANFDRNAHGIHIESSGGGTKYPLQHVVVADNTISHLRLGSSEALTVDGNVRDFLIYKNRVYDNDNIGIDLTGWYEGDNQSEYGYIANNTVANIDSRSNESYAEWTGSRCIPFGEAAGGIYDDGAAYLWLNRNVVYNTNQGISLDTETTGKYTDNLLVTHNTVVNTAGTSFNDPSFGPNPPGVPGVSTVAGHDYDALYVDAFGQRTRIYNVYVHDNLFENASNHTLDMRYFHAPVVDFDGLWKNVMLWNNTVIGGGAHHRYNHLIQVDHRPAQAAGAVIDCTEYLRLSHVAPNWLETYEAAAYQTLYEWREGNIGASGGPAATYDAHSTVGKAPNCAPSIR